jgi:hypothetical protein
MTTWAEHKCSFCDEPRESFVGDEDKPVANLCHEHAARFVKANAKRRGRMLALVREQDGEAQR